MRCLVFDARMWGFSGIGVYIEQLLIHLLPRLSGIEVILLVNPASFPEKRFPVETVDCAVPVYSFSEQKLLPQILRRLQPALYHQPHYPVPLGYRGKIVTSVHDLIHRIFPRFQPLAYLYSCWMLPHTVQKSERILVSSENTAKDLRHFYPVSVEKIRVIPLSPPNGFSPLEPEIAKERLRHRWGLSGNFFLYVGNLKASKNVQLLVKVFRHLNHEGQIPPDWHLVLVGRDFLPHWSRLIRKACPEVIFIPEADRTELQELYSAAQWFIFPSLYEGFGLPPLEAMSCGCPVMASSAASLPEVLGDAGLYFSPNNPNELARLISRVIAHPDLRKEFSRRGQERVKHFSWEETARLTQAVYQEVIG